MNAEAESKSGFPHFISVWPMVRWWGRRVKGGVGVTHSAETLHFNPIYSLPQQKIITTLKSARRGLEEKASLTKTVPLAHEVSTQDLSKGIVTN